MYAGLFFACLTGMIMPSFIMFMGDVMDSMQPTLTPDETLEEIRKICAFMGILALIVIIGSYLQWSLTLGASVKICARIKNAYLEAILKQDCSWFDSTNYTELSARLSKEVLAI